MSCGVNIPLREIAEALVNEYKDIFASIALDNLTPYVREQSGVAHDLTLRGSVTLDDAARQSLCDALVACLLEKTKGGEITSFAIDNTNDLLSITATSRAGVTQVFSVSKQELEDWLNLKGGGITGGAVVGTDIVVNNKDGTTANIDVSALRDYRVAAGVVRGNRYIDLTFNDTSLPAVVVDAIGLIPQNSPYIVSGVFVERDNRYLIDFVRNDDTHVEVDMTDIIQRIADAVYQRVMATGYRINNQADDYTLAGDDFDGRTIVRMTKNADTTLTLPKPPDTFVGKAVIVRKINGDPGTFLNLVSSDPTVVLNPPDATPLRRQGASATLVYTGDSWDIYGELP